MRQNQHLKPPIPSQLTADSLKLFNHFQLNIQVQSCQAACRVNKMITHICTSNQDDDTHLYFNYGLWLLQRGKDTLILYSNLIVSYVSILCVHCLQGLNQTAWSYSYLLSTSSSLCNSHFYRLYSDWQPSTPSKFIETSLNNRGNSIPFDAVSIGFNFTCSMSRMRNSSPMETHGQQLLSSSANFTCRSYLLSPWKHRVTFPLLE